MAGIHFPKLGKGGEHTKTPKVGGSNIYEGMMTQNVTERTYTTNVDGTSIPLNYMARTTPGELIQTGMVGFSGRQPKGMTLQTQEGPKQVHTLPKHY
jgi:hypothetical protein